MFSFKKAELKYYSNAPPYSLILKQTLKTQQTRVRRKEGGGMCSEHFISQASLEGPSCASKPVEWK